MILEKQQFDLWLFLLKQQKKVLSFSKPVSMQEQVNSIRSVCICMPRNHKHFKSALDCVNRIKNNDIDVTLIVGGQENVTDIDRVEVLRYPVNLKKPFPVKDVYLEHISAKYDVTIDLSPEPDTLSAYITGSRSRKMSIGLKSGKFDVFYTALIEPVGDYKKAVETMLNLAGLIIE